MLERGQQAMQAPVIGRPVVPSVALGASASGAPGPVQAHPVRDEFLAAFEGVQNKMHEIEDLFTERLQALARIGTGTLQVAAPGPFDVTRPNGAHFIPLETSMPERDLTPQQSGVQSPGAREEAPEVVLQASAAVGAAQRPSTAQAPAQGALTDFLEDQQPSVLTRPERDRLVELWGREPNLGPGEILERNRLEARLRGEAPIQDGISQGLADEMRTRLEALVEWGQNTGSWEAPCWREAEATLTRVYGEKRGLTSIECEMVDVLSDIWNRADRLDAADAPELTEATERLMTSIDKLVGTREFAPALLDALEGHLHRWDDLDDEDAPELGDRLRAVVAKAGEEGLVSKPLPEGELPTRPLSVRVPATRITLEQMAADTSSSLRSTAALAERALVLGRLAQFGEALEPIMRDRGFRSGISGDLDLTFDKKEVLDSGLTYKQSVKMWDTRLKMECSYEIADAKDQILASDQMHCLPEDASDVLAWFDRVRARVNEMEGAQPNA